MLNTIETEGSHIIACQNINHLKIIVCQIIVLTNNSIYLINNSPINSLFQYVKEISPD